MGKKGGGKKLQNAPNLPRNSITLRQETTGRIPTKGAARDSKSFFKLDHLQKLAVWASGEASIPSLTAFFGRQYAAAGEVSGIPPDPSLFSCQRCETILQPGFNCTVRIERTSAKARHRRKKPSISVQNNVVYNCHFCSHKNLKRGTPKGHMKEICPAKAKQKPAAKSKPSMPLHQKSASKEAALPPVTAETSITDGPTTPSVTSCTTLLDAKKRKRNRSGSKRSEGSESSNAANKDERTAGASSKRRKSWMSLKEITESNEHGSSRNFSNSIPFLI
ncbi:uncharacterized protein [Euphorbia lathyris]|uniref:uncharacterized protein n=1 Tax=Euphorbia lathyris TaxID=212925 RepID=UPI003313FDEA